MTALLEHHKHNDSTFYTGPLAAGMGLAGQCVAFGFEEAPNGKSVCHLYASALDDHDDFIAWGVGEDMEEATRYALGSEFGPIDEMYDEPTLRLALSKFE